MYRSLSILNVAHIPTQLGIREWVTTKTFAEAYENRASLHTDIAEVVGQMVRANPKLLELRMLSTGQKPRVTFLVGEEGTRTNQGVESLESEPN